MAAKAYWVARIEVKDPERMKRYAEAASAAIRAHGGRYIARGGRVHCPEGEHLPRNVIIEFPDYATAEACWYSDEYQAAIKLRRPYAVGDFIIVEGCDEPAA
ncbi:MAG TPA: DUF1330 domain-containing protein [Parvularculaceae bacterium]|nr:DUF1330 domain-containing protein [Parvularculaceae bacterium]